MCAQRSPVNIHLLFKNSIKKGKKKGGEKRNQALEATPLILGQKY